MILLKERATMNLKIAIIYGSVRENRKGINGAKFLENKCRERGWDAVLIDAKEYEHPFLDKMHKEFPEGEAPEVMQKVSDILKGSDAFIIVTGEYNHSAPPALTNLIDHYQSEYYFKPSGIACYSAGSLGGVRAGIHMRAFLSELGMSSIPSMFVMSRIGKSFDENGSALDEAYEKRVKKFLDEFGWYASALKEARKNGTPY